MSRPRRSIAVIGATGQFGRALVAEFAGSRGWHVLALAHEQVEITEPASIAAALDTAVDVVVNTAFWPGEEPEPALRVNALGPRLLAEHCAARNRVLVHVSTDYVFDGDASEPYRETDRADPRSVYGISKLAGELLVRRGAPRHLIVRVSSLYDVGGSRAKGGTSFPSVILDRARRGEALRVVSDQIYSPTYAPDAAVTVADLLEREVTGTVHVSNSGWCSRLAFAQKLVALAGLGVEVAPIRLADLPPGQPQPRYSVLAHDGLRAAGIASPRPWEEGLRDFLARQGALVAG